MLDRKYHLWTSGNIGDEFHQLLECQNIKGSRNLYIIFGQILQFRVNIIKLENQIKAEKITEVYKVHKHKTCVLLAKYSIHVLVVYYSLIYM